MGKMQKQSAGIVLYRFQNGLLQIFLVHPGGPFWKNKDAGAWSIPKGEFTGGETALHAAKREFKEETGIAVTGSFRELAPVKMQSGKVVYAWALEMDIDATSIKSNTFEMEWPPKSGSIKGFPEVDKAQWFSPGEAMEKINTAQASFIIQLQAMLP